MTNDDFLYRPESAAETTQEQPVVPPEEPKKRVTKKQILAVGAVTALLGVGIGGVFAITSPSGQPNSAPVPVATSPSQTSSTSDTPSSTPSTTHSVAPTTPSATPKQSTTTPVPVMTPALVALVDSLKTEDPNGATIPDYSRDQFGSRAPTAATREDLVQQEKLDDGTWQSLWDLKTYPSASGDYMEADHTVALAEAWRSGAWAWTDAKRVAYANDLTSPYTLNLITASLNQTKGDKDPFDWMPQYNRCEYVKEWTSIKLAWGLTADGEEKMALHNYAETCSG